MYKVELLRALEDDYRDAAEHYLQERDRDAIEAMRYAEEMRLLGKNIKYVIQMMDGTIGKNLHITSTHAAPTMKA